MLFVCIVLLFFAIDFCKCFLFSYFGLFGLLAHSLFISSMILHHAQCFYSVGFPNSMFTSFFLHERAMCSGDIALKNNHYYYYI